MKAVGCAGILVEDTFCGPMEALPSEGQLLVLEAMPVKAGGCAANVAIDLAKQGVKAEVAGCVGADPSADVVVSCLTANRVGVGQLARVEGYPTAKTSILLVKGQDRRYIHVFGANRAFTAAHLKPAWLETLGAFYLGGLFALPNLELDELRAVLELCRSRKIPTIVDVVAPQSLPNLHKALDLLPFVDFFLPNVDEARLITGRDNPLDQLKVFRASGAHTVVVTQGRTGAVAASGEQYWQCGAYATDGVDPSGSGDAFCAGIITGVVRGFDMEKTLRYASALGASATRAVGTTDGVFSAGMAESFIASQRLAVRHGSF